MTQVSVNLTGWKAIVVLVAVLGLSGYRVHSRFRTVDDVGRGVLRTWLANDYVGRGPRGLAQRVAEYRAGLPSPPAPASTPDVELVSLSAHGLPGIMVVRAAITVDGGPPPHGPSVRYLDLTTKVEGGWMVLAESDAIGYYLALFR